MNIIIEIKGKLIFNKKSYLTTYNYQALILVQAMTRKQTARLPNKNVTFDSPLILLNEIMKDSILSHLYNDLYSNINISINDEINYKSNNATEDITYCQDQNENNDSNDKKKRKFEAQTFDNKNKNEDEKIKRNYLIDFTSSQVGPVGDSKDTEFKNILEKLGVTYHPLDESFISMNQTFKSSLPIPNPTSLLSSALLSSAPSSSSSASSSIFPDNGIPVLQVLLIDENKNTTNHNSENLSTLAYLRPVRQSCTYALLVLPTSGPLSSALHPVNSNKNILNPNTKVVLKSTKSLAYIQMDE